MTGAYAGILNGGSAVTPYGIVGKEGSGIGERVIQKKAAQTLTWMMEKVVSEGTGKRAKMPNRQAAGKTGTSQEARDAWFIGFTADYVTGVWMGYDDNTPLKGVTGSGLPADIWRETMIRVHAGLPPRPLPMLVPTPPRVQTQSEQPQVSQRQETTPRTTQNTPRNNQPSNRQQDNNRALRKATENVVNQVLRSLFGGNRDRD